MADEERGRAGAAPDIIDEINALLRLGVGDQYRLEHIKLAYVENRTIWESDRRYLERMREKYIADLRRGEPVDDDRDVMAAAGAASGPPGGPAAAAAAAAPEPAAPPPTPQPQPGADRGLLAPDAAASPDPTASPDPAPPPAPAPPGSPESAASDAEDFGAGPDGAASGPAVIHCWKCGKKNLLKANFCMRCGVLLFDVGNARADAESVEYAASSAPPAAGRSRAAAAAAAAAAGGESGRGAAGARAEGGSSSRRAVLIGVGALVGILFLVAVLTSSVEIEIGGVDEEDGAANATAPAEPPATAAPEPEPAPEPPPP